MMKFLFIKKRFSRKVHQCCENYELDPESNECRPICITPCENYGVCVNPNTCKCDYGYDGKYCENGK